MIDFSSELGDFGLITFWLFLWALYFDELRLVGSSIFTKLKSFEKREFEIATRLDLLSNSVILFKSRFWMRRFISLRANSSSLMSYLPDL